MANKQIPNLPAVFGLSGAELFEGVQNGTSVKISLSQMITAVWSSPVAGAVIPVSSGGTGANTFAAGYLKASGTNQFSTVTSIPSTDITGLGTMAVQNANGVAVTGGNINGTAIGATTRSTGAFTTLNANAGITGSLTGNASTATALQTARTIALSGDVVGSASFDGSANITIASVIQPNSVALGTDTTGNYVASVANGAYITGGAAGSEGAALTLAVDATSANTASKVVARDASGNFSAGTITAALSGNASTTSALQTSRSLWSQSFNGTADITGNLVAGPNAGFISTAVDGSIVSNGSGVYPFGDIVSGSLTPNASATSSLVVSPAMVSDNGLSNSVYMSSAVFPTISNSGAAGSNAIAYYGGYFKPLIISTGATAATISYALVGDASRGATTDVSASASNTLNGVYGGAGHNTTLPSTAVTSGAYAISAGGYNYSGSMTSLNGMSSSVAAGALTGSASTVTDMSSLRSRAFTVGTATGPAANVTNGYGVRLAGPAVAATGTMTNYYALRADAPTGAGVLTNRYGIYINDALSANYFAGNVGVGLVPTARNNTTLQVLDGVGFPATQVPSTDPNTLDDYEEGTFTPTIIGTTTAGVGTYTTQTGSYTKVGNIVTYRATLVWTAHTGTGTMRVAGLPFSASDPTNVGSIMASNLTYIGQLISYVNTTQVVLIQEATAAAVSAVTLDTAATVYVAGQYFV